MGNKFCSCGNKEDSKETNEENLENQKVGKDIEKEKTKQSKTNNTRDKTSLIDNNNIFFIASVKDSEIGNTSLYNISNYSISNHLNKQYLKGANLLSERVKERINIDNPKVVKIYTDNQANKIINAYRRYITLKNITKSIEIQNDNQLNIKSEIYENNNNSNININTDAHAILTSNLIIDHNKSILNLPPLINIKSSNTSRTIYSSNSSFGIRYYINKSKYVGEFLNEKCNGLGKFTTEPGDIILGEFKENDLIGYATIKRSQGAKYEGEIKNNLLQGIGTENFNDKSSYSGEYNNNAKEGIGIYTFADGSKYRGEWKENYPNGYGYYSFYDGRLYEGEWKNGFMNGIGCFKWNDGKKYIGSYENDKRTGFGIFIWKIPLRVYIGFWKGGKQKGYGKVISNGKEKYCLWNNSKKEKKFKNKEDFYNEIKNKGINMSYMCYFKMNLDDIISIIVEF